MSFLQDDNDGYDTGHIDGKIEGREEGRVKGYNEALDDVIIAIRGTMVIHPQHFKEFEERIDDLRKKE